MFELEREKQIEELTAMLGAEARSARQSAEELLNYVESIKQAALSAGVRALTRDANPPAAKVTPG